MKRLRTTLLALSTLLASCWQEGAHCVEGVGFIFLCDEGVEVTHGAKDLPATCTYDYGGLKACNAEQEADEMLQYVWDDAAHDYVLACLPKCQKWHAEDDLCYEPCEAAADQKGVHCIRGHGNQWLLEQGTTTCE